MNTLDPIAETATRQPRRNSLQGATGMSRAALARLFRENGLFGRESDLTAAEQAVIRNAVGALPGVPVNPVRTDPTSARLDALVAFVGAVIAEADARAPRARLHALGLRSRAVDEAERVVENVREVFGFAGIPRPASLPAPMAIAA